MREPKKFLAGLDRVERIGLILLIVSFAAAGFVTLLYLFLGHRLIESIYNEESFDFLNRLIEYQHKYPLEHYLILGQKLFFRALLLGFLFEISVFWGLFIFYRLIFSNKPIHFLWLLGFAILLHRMPFILNPNWCFYYTHGFYRAALSYQILIGHTPPLDPFYAEGIMRSPWAFPWLSAQLSRLFNITPFLGFNLINGICMGLSLWLVYRIASTVTKDRKARLLSAIMTVFAITPLTLRMIIRIGEFLTIHSGEPRATPFFRTCLSACGDALGVVFSLLAIWAIFRFLQFKHILRDLFLLGLALLGCGLSYPALYPGLCLGLAAMIILWFFRHPDLSLRQRAQTAFLPMIILILVYLLLLPYTVQIGSRVSSNFVFFRPSWMKRNVILFLIAFGPVLAVLFWRISKLQKPGFSSVLLLFAFSAANALAYVAMHGPRNLEYKFLHLIGLGLGISAGPALYSIRFSRPRICFLLLLAFFYPSVDYIINYSGRYNNHPLFCILSKNPRVFSDGKYIHPQNSEEDQLYRWIRMHTSQEAVFIDSSWDIPVFAHRRLWVPMDRYGWSTWISGYISLEVLQMRNGYDVQKVRERVELLSDFYRKGSPESLPQIISADPSLELYFVSRPEQSSSLFASGYFTEEFKTSSGNFRIYRLSEEGLLLRRSADPAGRSPPPSKPPPAGNDNPEFFELHEEDTGTTKEN